MRLIGTLADIFGKIFTVGQPYLRHPSEAAEIQEVKELNRWKGTVKITESEDGTIFETKLQEGAFADLTSAVHNYESKEQKEKYVGGLAWISKKYV